MWADLAGQRQQLFRHLERETILRDVVVYQNRMLGSTKRSLVVVTGKVLSGFDLDRGTEVEVDHDAKVVRVVLPPAAVLGVEITDLRTYDEQRGLWNPFRPADRDSIFRLAREQLVHSAGEVELAKHTQESARRLLEAMVRADGYRTEITFADDSYAVRMSALAEIEKFGMIAEPQLREAMRAEDAELRVRARQLRERVLSPEPIAHLGGHRGDVEVVCFSPDSRLLATACRGGDIKVWPTSNFQDPVTLQIRTDN